MARLVAAISLAFVLTGAVAPAAGQTSPAKKPASAILGQVPWPVSGNDLRM